MTAHRTRNTTPLATLRARRQRRSGVVAVEFALTAPLVFLFFFAAFEFSRMNMIHHTLDLATYEAARKGMVPGATAEEVIQRAEQILGTVMTRGAVIEVDPNPLTTSGEKLTVKITVPLSANAWVFPNFLRGVQLEQAITLRRELPGGGKKRRRRP